MPTRARDRRRTRAGTGIWTRDRRFRRPAALELATLVCAEQRDLGPRDMIDAQWFLWVQGSAEYEE
jgi:hypothetical protein